MISIKMANGINLNYLKKIKANYFSELFKYEKFFLVLLTFIIFLLSTQKAFSLNLWDCKKDENVDYQTLINEFEKSSKVWINSKNYNFEMKTKKSNYWICIFDYQQRGQNSFICGCMVWFRCDVRT